jgi:trans-2,3-dihydro-3-hydroxyanthranilate isomerase
MNTHRYRVVDVFTTNALEGNPLAVFPDARGLDDGTMQRIARELNLAETAFVFPATDPGCVVRVRIFTPETEMSFAGHPTIGTSAVLVDEGIVDRNISEFVLEEKIGPVRIRRDQSSAGPMFWLTTPQISFGKTFDRESCARALS